MDRVEVGLSGVAMMAGGTLIVGGTLCGVPLIVSGTLIFLCHCKRCVMCVFCIDNGYGNMDL